MYMYTYDLQNYQIKLYLNLFLHPLKSENKYSCWTFVHVLHVFSNSLWKAAWLWECLLLLYPFCPCEWEVGREFCCAWGGCEGCWAACWWGGVWVGVGGRGAGVMTWACGDAVWRRGSLWLPCSGSMEPDTVRTTEGSIRPDLNPLTFVGEQRLK